MVYATDYEHDAAGSGRLAEFAKHADLLLYDAQYISEAEYVADTARGTIYRIATEGDVCIVTKDLNEPMGLCWYGGALYVAESGENKIVRVEFGAGDNSAISDAQAAAGTESGNLHVTLTVVAGTGDEGHDDGAVASATFSYPRGVAVASDGTVYIADTVNASVRRLRNGVVDTILSPDDKTLTTYPTSPAGMCIDDGFLYVCDCFSRRVYILPL